MVPVAINKQTCTISTLLSPSTPPGLQQHVHVAPSKYLQMDPIIPYKCIATSTRGVQVVQRQIHGCMVGLQDQLHTHTTSWLQDQLTHPHKKLGPGSSCSYTQRNRLHIFFVTHTPCLHSFICYVAFILLLCLKLCPVSVLEKTVLASPPQTKLWCLSLTHPMLQAFICFVSSSHNFLFLGEKQSPALHTLQFFRRK
jgi:hypothetical protein